MAKGSPFVIIFAGLLLTFGPVANSQLLYDTPSALDTNNFHRNSESWHQIDDTSSQFSTNPYHQSRNFQQNLLPNLQSYDFSNFRDVFDSDEQQDAVGRDLPSTINIATATNSDVGIANTNPFQIDVITSDVPHNPGHNFFFQNSLPLFENHPFFSGFGGASPFGIFNNNKRKEPWWKGANVCTDRTEDEKDQDTKKPETVDSNEDTLTQLAGPTAQLFGGFQFSLNSCVEKQHKHVCKQVYNMNGKKKTLTITRQCCHGFGRSREADLVSPCEPIDLKPIPETAEEMGAKEFMKSAKNNGLDEKLASNVTVFIPTDTAFTEFSETMFENNLVFLPKSQRVRRQSDDSSISFTTKDLALNHIVDGWINMEDIRNEDLLTTNYQNSTIRINIFPNPPESQLNDGRFRFTANCAPIVKVNKIAQNGMVHVVDRVLSPVSMTIMDIIRKREDMTVLRTILEKTKMNELLEGDKPVTIFAPTDKAFQKLEQNLRRTLKEGKGCATNILKNHILDLTFCSVAVITDAKTTAYNLLGEPMTFERSSPKPENDTKATEVADLTGLQDILVNGKAKIIETDMMGTNGVLHVVDTIMPTESALPITSLMEKKNLTIFKSLIEASNLQDELNDLSNVTFFAPTDKAFDGTEWKQKLTENPESLKDSTELKEFLNYHIVEPMTKTCDFSERLIDSKTGTKLRINLYSTHPLFTNVMNRATVNCARLMHFDDESCGSVLHQVDKVLTSPKQNLLQSLESNPNYSKFLDLIKSANLTSILEDETTAYTVLIPKNEVFEESDEWYQRLIQNSNQVNDLVQTHIVNDVICCAGIIPTSFPFVRRIDTINNGHLRITRDRRPKIENAAVTKCDIIATNGIVHEINDVIQARQRTNPNRQQHNFESFGDLIF